MLYHLHLQNEPQSDMKKKDSNTIYIIWHIQLSIRVSCRLAVPLERVVSHLVVDIDVDGSNVS